MCISIYSYEYMYVHSISISIFERLNRLDFKIYEVDHQEHLTVDGDVASHWKNN
jgi:hypothetical protein